MTDSIASHCAWALVLALITSVSSSTFAAEPSFDGLVAVEGAPVGMLYIDPKADFGAFDRVLILEPYVAFRADWQRDQNRNRRRNLRAADVERIRSDIAALFRQVFGERLRAGDGFEIVEQAGENVLALRPAIIDLDITAPDNQAPGRGRTFTATSGAATLYIQLVDSVTGDVLGRAADRRVVRGTTGNLTWSNRVTNTDEARRMFRAWADQLRSFLDQHYIE